MTGIFIEAETKINWKKPFLPHFLFRNLTKSTECFNTPPPQPIWASVHMKTVCFQDPIYQFQITMQVFRTIAQLTYFRSYGLCVKVEPIFMNIFWLYFWGDFPKVAMKSSIIGLDIYIIPHFKANMSWYASVSQQCLFHKCVL